MLTNGKFFEETIIIGHSTEASLILSILENIDKKIKQAILVSGYAQPLPEKEGLKREGKFNWSVIREHLQDIIFINSDNDPWGCDDKQGRIMFDNLGGTLIIKHEGHMGSTTYNQPYREFPLLLKLIAD